MFIVVTDPSHTAGLTMHATILAYKFTLIETEEVGMVVMLILILTMIMILTMTPI